MSAMSARSIRSSAVIPGAYSALPHVSVIGEPFGRVQVAAIETTGMLLNQEALPDLKDALGRARDAKVKRAALTAIAMLPSETRVRLHLAMQPVRGSPPG